MDISESLAPPAARAGWRIRVDRYLAANLMLWVFTYLLTTLRMIMPGDTSMPKTFWPLAGRRAIVCFVAFLACLLIQRVLFAIRPWPVARRLAVAFGLSIAGGAFYGVFNFSVMYLIAPVWKQPFSATDAVWGMIGTGSVLVWSFIAWCAIVFAMDYDREVREKSLRLVQAQALAAESQNRMLRDQINPHFLFNTLNALSSLILSKDYARAEQVVLSLSGFLRASLEKEPGDKTPLSVELEAQQKYLAIEQIRFAERLQLNDRIPRDAGRALVPSLILQPLVENAVKHGVARSTAPVRIEILAEAKDGRLTVTVQDDAVPDIAAEPVKLGVGLENVRKRLALMYGERARLVCGRREGGGFAAVLELPLERR